MQEAVEGGRGGQGTLVVGGAAGEDADEGVVAGAVGVVAVGVAGEELVDLLDEQGLEGVLDEERGAGVGQALGEIGQDAEPDIELADGEEAGVLDEASGGEIDDDRLRAGGPSHRVAVVALRHVCEPP